MARKVKGNKNSTKAPTNRKKTHGINWEAEDAFHDARDSIMLTDNQKELYSDDDLANEVFALPDKGDVFADEDEPQSEEEVTLQPTKKQNKKTKANKKIVEERESGSESDEHAFESWGRKKSAYYSTNAHEIDEDDEEAQQLEEAEVLRLQLLAREQLEEMDFGVNDAVNIPQTLEDDPVQQTNVPENLPQGKDALLSYLQRTRPETLALARDWEDTVEEIARTESHMKEYQQASISDPSLGMIHLYHQTLLAYATTLAFYLHLCIRPKYASSPNLLRTHPVMSRLLVFKHALGAMKSLDFAPDSEDNLSEDERSEMESLTEDMERVWGLPGFKPSLEDNELEELLRDAQEDINILVPKKRKTKNDENKAPSFHETSTKGKKTKKDKDKDKKSKQSKQPKITFDLEEPAFVPNKRLPAAINSSSLNEISSFGEDTSLDTIDAQDKSARKRSLRFHTSKIESKTAQRAKARNAASGGDDDIPYRERQKEKELRLQKEAQKKKLREANDMEDLEMADATSASSASKKRRWDELDDDEDDDGSGDEPQDDGYYELVKRRKLEAKETKKAAYDAEKAAEKAEREGEDVNAEGPRSLTRAILKNKGLTPHRSKSVRNPRVKKRQKYEQAKKKIRSQKATYKGGLASTGGRYEGESSGISKRTVKSVKLG